MTLIDTVDSTLSGTQEEVEICCNNKKEDCNKHSVTPTNKSLKGIYLRSLQHRDDMIMALVDRIMSTNHILLQANTELQLASKQSNCKCCCNKNNNRFINQDMESKLDKMIEEQHRRRPPHPYIDPTDDDILNNNQGFPPSSVEQALKKGFQKNMPGSLLETELGEKIMEGMVEQLLKNPSIIPKLMEMGMNADKNNVNKDLLLSKPEEFKKASQEIVNKSLTKEDENQLQELAARIDKQEKELKEQEIRTFLQSETDVSDIVQ